MGEKINLGAATKEAIGASEPFKDLLKKGDAAEIERQLNLVVTGKVEDSVFKGDKKFLDRFGGDEGRKDVTNLAEIFGEIHTRIREKLTGASGAQISGVKNVTGELVQTALREHLAGVADDIIRRNDNSKNSYRVSIDQGNKRVLGVVKSGVISGGLAEQLREAVKAGEEGFCDKNFNGYFDQAIAAFEAKIGDPEISAHEKRNLMTDLGVLTDMLGSRRGYERVNDEMDRVSAFRGELMNYNSEFRQIMADEMEI